MFDALAEAVFAVSPAVRYFALGRGQDVRLTERPGLEHASSGESDRYEELLVNPALVTLARQRDVSVAIERDRSPVDLVDPIRSALRSVGLGG